MKFYAKKVVFSFFSGVCEYIHNGADYFWLDSDGGEHCQVFFVSQKYQRCAIHGKP